MTVVSFMQNAIVVIAFLTACAGALFAVYRKAVKPMAEAMEAVKEVVTAQLTANGGGSLVDNMNRVAGNHAMAEAHWIALKEHQQEIKVTLEERTSQIDARMDKLDAAVEQTGFESKQRGMLIVQSLTDIEILRDKVDKLQEHALAKAEAREIPPEPATAPEGHAILPRQIVALEPDGGHR